MKSYGTAEFIKGEEYDLEVIAGLDSLCVDTPQSWSQNSFFHRFDSTIENIPLEKALSQHDSNTLYCFSVI